MEDKATEEARDNLKLIKAKYGGLTPAVLEILYERSLNRHLSVYIYHQSKPIKTAVQLWNVMISPDRW